GMWILVVSTCGIISHPFVLQVHLADEFMMLMIVVMMMSVGNVLCLHAVGHGMNNPYEHVRPLVLLGSYPASNIGFSSPPVGSVRYAAGGSSVGRASDCSLVIR